MATVVERIEEAQTLLDKILHSGMLFKSDVEPELVRAKIIVTQGETRALRDAVMVEEKLHDGQNRRNLARARRVAGQAMMGLGELEQAEPKLREALALFEQLDTPWQQGRTMAALGELWRRRGEATLACGYFSRALVIFEQMQAVPDAARTRLTLESLPEKPKA